MSPREIDTAKTTMPTQPPLSVVPSVVDPRDWIFAPAADTLANLPDAVDLRDAPDGLPPVYDQGVLNSCTANVMAAALHFDMRRRKVADAFGPSRLFIYYNERKEEGTIGLDPVHGQPVQMRDCIDSVSTKGVCAEAQWPYVDAQLDVCPPDPLYQVASGFALKSQHRVTQDVDHLRAALAEGYPVLFGLNVYAGFPLYRDRGVSVIALPDPAAMQLGGHALLAVGYDNARAVFIARNSWGGEWGDGGYCYLPFGYLTDPNLTFDHWVINAPQGTTP